MMEEFDYNNPKHKELFFSLVSDSDIAKYYRGKLIV